ncbi:hypothetical protein C8R43DRAFT_1193499 [Mycena crocata]|nr:hypothetical protein C8R43DRAFT_1179273 [Mycena crocata]KAJ7177508.1 hypothetical protein C8R43DRAFT_1193499 [Mycena crocata]
MPGTKTTPIYALHKSNVTKWDDGLDWPIPKRLNSSVLFGALLDPLVFNVEVPFKGLDPGAGPVDGTQLSPEVGHAVFAITASSSTPATTTAAVAITAISTVALWEAQAAFSSILAHASIWRCRQEELLLYSVDEERARRRGPQPIGVTPFAADFDDGDAYDDEGKGVFNKPRALKAYQSIGCPRYPSSPPPTSIDVTSVVYTLLSCWTRFHNIGYSNTVVRDEAHVGKFGRHYVKREFYFDVQPPLGKMHVGLV